MKSKANKGKGRFSFIAFSSNAEWHTVYKDNDVYKEYDIVIVKAKRAINADASKRGAVDEVIIRNYGNE